MEKGCGMKREETQFYWYERAVDLLSKKGDKKMQEIVINRKHGGFGLSQRAVKLYSDRKGLDIQPVYAELNSEESWRILSWDEVFHMEAKTGCKTLAYWNIHYLRPGFTGPKDQDGYCFSEKDIPRDDPDLVAVVRNLGDEANGPHATLKIVEVPDGIDWQIEEYDGLEWVAERHRTWG